MNIVNRTIGNLGAGIVVWMAAAASLAGVAQAAVTQTIEPATIGLGGSAQLTISASGADAGVDAGGLEDGCDGIEGGNCGVGVD